MLKRKMNGMVVSALTASMLAGLGGGVTAYAEEDPYEVNLLYIVSSEKSGQDAVEAAVNELAMKELNMTVNLIPMTYGTFLEQLPMMLAANEDLDVMPINSRDFATFIESQYVVDLSSYLDGALSDAVEVIGESDIAACKIGDTLVGLPEMKERSFPNALIVRKDIFDELGFSVDDFKVDPNDMTTWEKVTELFAAVHEAYPDMTVFDGTNAPACQTNAYTDTLGDEFGMGRLENNGQTLTVTNYFESEQFKNFCELARDWYLAGYSSPDIATNTDDGETKMKAGNTFSYMTNWNPATSYEKYAQTGYEVECILLSPSMKNTNTVNGLVYGVASASKDPEKACEFLNWLYTSAEVEDLLNWGIEGTDWVEGDDGLAHYPEGVTSDTAAYHNGFGWALPNQFIAHAWEGYDPDIWTIYKEYNDSNIKSQALGFTFDSTSVSDQIATCNSVYQQYYKDLSFGAVEIEPALKDFNDALYAAGLQDVIDEKQAQLDAWVAEQ